jgi:hypothetical protein
MSVTCLNCGTEIRDEFCPHCGQKKDVKKLTWHSLLHEILHFFSHIEEGFLKTSYQLIIRPGRTIREYLAGKRKKYYKPASLYLVWVAIFLLTHKLISSWMHYEGSMENSFLFFTKETGNYFAEHRNVFELLLMPIMALSAWLIITRPKMNYIETLVLGIYIFSGIQVLLTMQLIVNGLLLQSNFMTNRFKIQTLIIDMGWTFFCFMSFCKGQKIKLLPLRILFAMAVTMVVYFKLGSLIVDLILRMRH